MPPPSKGGGALKWVLIGVGAFLLLAIAAVSIGGYLFYRTVRNAGFDPDLMKKNPGLAMARMATAMNPDVEVVSTDEGSGTITVRDKKTGKLVTLKFDPEKKTMVVINDEGKQAEVKISGDGTTGSIDVTGDDGTKVRFGNATGNATPQWVPVYPGSTPKGTMTADMADGTQNTFVFQTQDPASKVMTFYEEQLKSSGFNITMNAKTGEGGMLIAESSDKKRALTITAGTSSEGTQGSITAVEKK